MSKINFEAISEYIYVYKDLLNDWEDLVKILKHSEENPKESFFFKDWQKWSFFGTYVLDIPSELQKLQGKELENFLIKSTQDQKKIFYKEKYFLEKIKKNFTITTDHYLSCFNLKKEQDWETMGPSFAKYQANNSFFENQDHAMQFHTDYVANDDSEKNFALTCTMYLNDDYEGGEVIFKINKEILKYTPKAGEIMVFPSGHPNFLSEKGQHEHAVSKVLKKDKHFIRCFYKI